MTLKIGLVQTKVSGDVEENLDKTARFIKQAARKGADIVCLQELFAYRYFAQTKSDRFFQLAEPIPGPLSQFLSKCASDNHVVLLGYSAWWVDRLEFPKQIVIQVGLGQGVLPHLMSMVSAASSQQESE